MAVESRVAPGARAERTIAAARGGGAWWLLGPPLIFLALFLLAPLVLVGVSSGAAGLRAALHDPLVGGALWRTLAIAATVTLITAVVGTVYALALTASTGVLRGVLLGCLLASFWISVLVRTLGWELLYEPSGPLERLLHATHLLGAGRSLDLLQTTAGMYPAMVHVMLPYMVLPIWGALAVVDAERLRAARSLGAGTLLVLRRIVLPEARAGLVAGMVLVFALSMGFYITPRILGGPGDLTVGTLVGNQFEATQTGDFSEPAAVALLLVAAILVLYAVSDRLLRISESWARR